MVKGPNASRFRVSGWLVLVLIFAAVWLWSNHSRGTSPSSQVSIGQSQANAACSTSDAAAKRLLSALTAARRSLANGHYAIAIRQSKVIENSAKACINQNDNADVFHYAHANAAFIEAQARAANGDTTSITVFMDATTEAQELADNSDADPSLRRLAANLVTMAHEEMKEIQSAKQGQLIKPPRELITPPPTP